MSIMLHSTSKAPNLGLNGALKLSADSPEKRPSANTVDRIYEAPDPGDKSLHQRSHVMFAEGIGCFN